MPVVIGQGYVVILMNTQRTTCTAQVVVLFSSTVNILLQLAGHAADLLSFTADLLYLLKTYGLAAVIYFAQGLPVSMRQTIITGIVLRADLIEMSSMRRRNACKRIMDTDGGTGQFVWFPDNCTRGAKDVFGAIYLWFSFILIKRSILLLSV